MASAPSLGPSGEATGTTPAVDELADLLADALAERQGPTAHPTGFVERPRASRRVVQMLEQLVSAKRVVSQLHPPAA